MKSLLILIGLCIYTLSQAFTPASYSSFATARQASVEQKKVMAIFFVSSSSAATTEAWEKFLNSSSSRDKVALLLNIHDFDGKIIFETYGPAKAPGWTLLNPDGTVKDKWEGSYDKVTINEPVTTHQLKETKPDQVVTETAKVDPLAQPALPAENNISGKVVQAGYFGSEANATKLITDLESKGFPGFQSVTQVNDGKTFFRVVSPTLPSETEADKLVQKLKTVGINSSIKPAMN